ncbi:phospholipid/cholesterol/gamma-HCH transport system substrate-binding protein [Streptomyces puniciscabiei]|uniref:Phospholipid/cholesterol/gamma-HCH transport system substrate-binding protein n=1 Tax=Streptomyces puniciscabiei TaxID=164348 RepID=A0A542U9D7_9ACTN|nr:MCE family protein [Streptomyces puniciscabiei]TQK95676.1 phospholipid/cholesterol/gamma-HCH transport system substrate-binding protein [Streptomyces puniciscabiei]
MTRRLLALFTALAVVVALAVALWPHSDPVRVTAYFPRTVGIYPGSDVRVLGVRIGEVEKITPEGGRVRVELAYDRGRKVPADAQAAIVNSSVVSDRYVQLLPVYRKGPLLRDGDVIPESRTAVPVELDRIFDSLHTTAEALGPNGANQRGSLSRLLGVSADNLRGQGKDLNQTVEDLSQAVTTLSDGRGDLFGTVRHLQVFTAALAADDTSVRSFDTDLADVAGQLAGERTDLAAALKYLAAALGDVSGFVKGNKKALTSDVAGLAKVTKVLVTQRAALEELLTVAPTGLSNLQNAYNPAAGTLDTRNNAQTPQDPASLLCSILRTTGDDHGSCTDLKKLFDSLPKLPAAPATTGTVDKTLGGILGARA